MRVKTIGHVYDGRRIEVFAEDGKVLLRLVDLATLMVETKLRFDAEDAELVAEGLTEAAGLIKSGEEVG